MGLVIRGADVFNTSRVFTVFTRDLGRVEGIAKGSRRLKSPFENGLDLLSICDIVILHKGNETLDLITEACLVERFEALRTDLPAMYAGCYVAELLNDLTHLHDPHPRLFDAAVITLRNLSDQKLMWRRLMRVELALLKELGLSVDTSTLVTLVSPVPSEMSVNFMMAIRSPSNRVCVVTASAILFS